MSVLATLVLSVGLVPQPAAASPGSSADEAAIRAVMDAFSAAWGRHDAKALVATYMADADFTAPPGTVLRGSAAIEKGFAADHGASGLFRSSTIKQTIDRIRFLKPDVAVLQGAFETSGAIGPQGAPLVPSPKGRLLLVFVKDGGQWKVASGMAMAPMGPPPAMD